MTLHFLAPNLSEFSHAFPPPAEGLNARHIPDGQTGKEVGVAQTSHKDGTLLTSTPGQKTPYVSFLSVGRFLAVLEILDRPWTFVVSQSAHSSLSKLTNPNKRRDTQPIKPAYFPSPPGKEGISETKVSLHFEKSLLAACLFQCEHFFAFDKICYKLLPAVSENSLLFNSLIGGVNEPD